MKVYPSLFLVAALVFCAALFSLGNADPSRPQWKTSFSVGYIGSSQDSPTDPKINHIGHIRFHSIKERLRVSDQTGDGTESVSLFDFAGSRAYTFSGLANVSAVCTAVDNFDTRAHPIPFVYPCNQDQTKFLGTIMLDATVTYAWSNCKMHISHRVDTPSGDLYTLHVDAFTGAPVYAYSPFESFRFNGYQEDPTPVDSYFYVPQEFESTNGVCDGGKLIQPRQWWPLVLILVIFLIVVCCITTIIATIVIIFRYHIKSLFTGEPLPDNAITFDKIKGIFGKKRSDDDQEETREDPTI